MTDVRKLAAKHSPEQAREGLLFEAWATYMLLELDRKLSSLMGSQLTINRKENQIMAQVQVAQEDLDADGDKLSQLATDLAGIIASGNLPPADQTKLKAGLDALTSLDTVTVAPPADPTS